MIRRLNIAGEKNQILEKKQKHSVSHNSEYASEPSDIVISGKYHSTSTGSKLAESTYNHVAQLLRHSDYGDMETAGEALNNGFDAINKNQLTDASEKELAKLGKRLTKISNGKIMAKMGNVILEIISTGSVEPVGQVIAGAVLKAADIPLIRHDFGDVETAGKILDAGFDAITKDAGTSESIREIAKLGKKIKSNYSNSDETVVVSKKDIMTRIYTDTSSIDYNETSLSTDLYDVSGNKKNFLARRETIKRSIQVIQSKLNKEYTYMYRNIHTQFNEMVLENGLERLRSLNEEMLNLSVELSDIDHQIKELTE